MNLIRRLLNEWLQEGRDEREGEAFVVLRSLANRRNLSLEELAKMTGESESRVRKSLKYLCKRGLVHTEFSMRRDRPHEALYRITHEGNLFYMANAPTSRREA